MVFPLNIKKKFNNFLKIRTDSVEKSKSLRYCEVWIHGLLLDTNLVQSFSEWEALALHAHETKPCLANRPLDLIEDMSNVLNEVVKKNRQCIGNVPNAELYELDSNYGKSQNYMSSPSYPSHNAENGFFFAKSDDLESLPETLPSLPFQKKRAKTRSSNER